MHKKLEAEFVKQCSPTLAGLKIANLFRFRFDFGTSPQEEVNHLRTKIQGKDLHIEILSQRLWDNSALIYVYRRKKLSALLQQPESISFFSRLRYQELYIPEVLLQEIAQRINTDATFPHEIGLLLGYPLADVLAYMAFPQAKGLCTGCWKAYSDPHQAQQYHLKCAKCTQVYWQCYTLGFPLERLALAV